MTKLKPRRRTQARRMGGLSFERFGQVSPIAQIADAQHPRATSMLDGAVAAIVAGPLSKASEEWVYPLLGGDNHDTQDTGRHMFMAYPDNS